MGACAALHVHSTLVRGEHTFPVLHPATPVPKKKSAGWRDCLRGNSIIAHENSVWGVGCRIGIFLGLVWVQPFQVRFQSNIPIRFEPVQTGSNGFTKKSRFFFVNVFVLGLGFLVKSVQIQSHNVGFFGKRFVLAQLKRPCNTFPNFSKS